MIETERLLLRPFVQGDAEGLFNYAKDPAVGPDGGWKPHESIEEAEQILQEVFLGQEDMFAIIEKEQGRLIGSIGLVTDPHRQNPKVRMLGYALGEAFWGKGYATEAAKAVLFYGFLEKGYDLISVTHYTYNSPSEGVILKCGFRKEGILRQGEERFDGVVLDFACYSLTKAEFLAQNKE